MKAVWLAAGLILCAATSAESLVQGGYQEAVFSVSSADDWVEMFEDVAGWSVLSDTAVDPRQLRGWQLPDAVTARAVVLGNPGTNRGFVRLMEFDGAAQLQIRSNGQTWDTGGWFDVNSRVLDMQQKFAELQALGWQSVSDPVEFAFGPFVVEEWLARGPDGIVVAVIERLQPPLEGHPALRQMGRFFNATQIVTDIDAAREFYENVLGFEPYLEHSGASKEPGPNVLGLPHNLATEVTRHVAILHPTGKNEGSVELIEFEGANGRDFAARAVPPNLGVLTLRFPVADIDAFCKQVEQRGAEVAMRPTRVTLPPYGDVSLLALRGPDGVWIEFFSD